MRTTEEMLDLIVNVAKKDPDIRAVLMSGSRANKDCPVDQYQDFDIVYFVKDVQPYWDNMAWIEEKFGKPILVHKPDSIELIPPDYDGNYMYLMLFEDGNRIDLQFTSGIYEDDGEPVVLLLDKDGTFPDIKVQEDFWYVRKPSQKYFADCCNEFHWCLNNVAKGIARDELSCAMKQHNEYVRNMLVLMLSWYVGTRHDFRVFAGKEGKYFKRYLPAEIYERFQKTYSDADYEHMWAAAFEMLYLFGDVARYVAEKLEFAYDEEEEQGIEKYMKMVRDGEI